MAGLDLADSTLRARAVVARLGERDLMAWWDDNALTRAGTVVARRLFPRTAALSQLAIALEAAAVRHRAAVPQPLRFTLFSLPAPLEADVRRRLLALQRGNGQPPIDVAGLIQLAPGRSPADILQEYTVTGPNELGLLATVAPTAGVLDLSGLVGFDPDDAGDVERALRLLVAGYAASGRGRLTVPVLVG